jgi:glucokinase
MGQGAVVGVDIGGTKTLCALVDDKYRIVQKIKFKTAPAEGRSQFTSTLIQTTRNLLGTAEQKKLRVLGVGIGFAGKVCSEKCMIEVAPNLVCLEKFNIGKLFSKELGLRTILGNDVQMGLYGEHQLGAAVGLSNVLGVFFGTGVGGAAIIDGKLYFGASGMGGQVGALLTSFIGGPEATESYGILDRLSSKMAIAGSALCMATRQWAPNLYREAGTDFSKITWGACARAIKKGDTCIEQLLRSRMRVAGIALANIVNFLNPELLVLGGGLTEELPDLVLPEVERGLREYIGPEISTALDVKVAQLKNRATVLGAAKHAMETLTKQQQSAP